MSIPILKKEALVSIDEGESPCSHYVYVPEPLEPLEYVNYFDSKDSVLKQVKKEFPEDKCLQTNCSVNSKIVPENKESLKLIYKQEVKCEHTGEVLPLNIKEEDKDIEYQFTLKTERTEDQDILVNAGVRCIHYDVLITPKEVQCKLCHKTFKTTYNLIKHNNEHITVNINILRNNQINGSHQCRYCNKCLNSHDNMLVDVSDVNSETNLKCQKCREQYKSEPNLEHQARPLRKVKNCLRESLTNKVKFNYCSEDSKPKYKLKNHLKLRRTSKKDEGVGYKCESCERVFKNKRYLKLHVKRIHCYYVGTFKCWCGKQFRTPINLNEHKKREHDPRIQTTDYDKLQCDSCQKVFRFKQSLLLHIRRMHHDYGKMFKCLCGKEFRTPIHLYEHKSQNHDGSFQNITKYQKFQCDSCQKIFKAKRILLKHIMRMHYDYGRMFECLCGKQFRSPITLNDHRNRLHNRRINITNNNNNKKFQCDSCQKIFRNKYKLAIHIKRMHYDYGRMFECFCGKQFRSPITLYEHKKRLHDRKINITSNEKFQCDLCQKIFRVKYKLVIHIKRMHYDYGRTFDCWCGKQFRTPVYLSTHKRLIHGRVIKTQKLPRNKGYRSSKYVGESRQPLSCVVSDA